MTDTYTFPNGDKIPIEYYEYIRNQVYQEVKQLFTDSDTYIGHNAYLPGHVVLKAIKGSDD